MVFTREQRAEWRRRPSVWARQRQHEEKRRQKRIAAKPARCLICGVFLDTRRKFCSSAHKALHHRQRPGVAEHLRQLQRERWHTDHVYRAEQLGRTAAWKASHPEAKPQERRRAHLRMLIAKYTAAVSIDVVVRDFTYLITHAAELKAALGISEAVSFEAAKQRTIATVRASRA